MPNNKIAIIICWYGDWPWYWPLFVKSVKHNPTVDFLIVTDEDITIALPNNIKVISHSFIEVKDLIQRSVGVPISLENPYKLCDFKPTYGLVFQEYLVGYQFWGYGDIDLIFGDIRAFLSNELLNTYDVISPFRDFLAGYFVLFRNNEKNKLLFTEGKDYAKIFQSPACRGFDECAMLHSKFHNGVNFDSIKFEIDTMTHIVKRDKEIKSLFELFCVQGIPGKLAWKNGKLILAKKYELMAYHLADFKREPYLYLSELKEIANSNEFYIHKNSISQSAPSTIGGRLNLAIAKRNKIKYFAAFFLSWICRYTFLTKSSNMSDENISFIEGRYKANHTIIQIYREGQNIYAKKDDEGADVLHHVKDYRFIIKKKKYLLDFKKTENDTLRFYVTDSKRNTNIFYKLI